MTGSGGAAVNDLMLICLFGIFGLLVADRVRARRHDKRDRARREKLREREARLREGWDAHHHAPKPAFVDRRRPWDGVERRLTGQQADD